MNLMIHPGFGIDLQIVLQGLILLVVGGGVKMLYDSLGDIRDHLGELNGRTAAMEQWQVDHEKEDERRFQETLVGRMK